ncbi:MAG: alanine:cation symporter family protein, partial [Oscillospiraceae bacterium]|nr:alanine:cation symporter family protein [Oscillospiraceae bacterium]
LNGLMAIPNLVGVLLLSPVVFKLTKEYFAKVDAEKKAAK